MLIIPAIDIKDGCVVRLVQGRTNKRVYSKDPLKTAKYWVGQGAKLIHIVDLDAALSGKIKNLGAVKNIARSVNVPIQFGGGARSIEAIKLLLNSGIQRVVLGTRAAEDEDFLKKVFKAFRNRIIVSIDAQAGKVLIKGWQAKITGRKNVLDFVYSLKEMGFKEFIYTDILKDGTLSGANIKGVKGLLKKSGMRIIASGGISSLEDIYKLKLLEKKGLIGVIVGKALYEGRFTLKEALRLA